MLTASQYLEENATGDEIDIYADSRHMMNTKPKILNACVKTKKFMITRKENNLLGAGDLRWCSEWSYHTHLDGFIIRGKQLEAIRSYQNFCISIFVALAPGQAKLLSNQSLNSSPSVLLRCKRRLLHARTLHSFYQKNCTKLFLVGLRA